MIRRLNVSDSVEFSRFLQKISPDDRSLVDLNLDSKMHFLY